MTFDLSDNKRNVVKEGYTWERLDDSFAGESEDESLTRCGKDSENKLTADESI